MKRKMLCLLMIGTLILALSGCGSKQGQATQEVEIKTQDYTSPLSDSSDQATESQGDSDNAQAIESQGDSDNAQVTESQEISDTSQAEKSQQTSSDILNTENQSASDSQQTAADQQQADYQVTMKTYYDKGSSSITYPVISGWSDEFQQDAWNQKFLKFAKQEAKAAKKNSKNKVVAKWQVKTSSSELLSLVVIYTEQLEGTAHAYTYCDTYNVNMTNGKKSTLTDLISAKEAANVLLHSLDYQISKEDLSLDEILAYQTKSSKKISEKQLIHDLKGFDKSRNHLLKKGGYQIYGSSFMENGKVVLVLDVSHGNGDYVWITMN